MIKLIIIHLNTIIFLLLSLLHVYWVFGGAWGIQYAMPEKYKVDYFNPKNKVVMATATLIVAIGLFLFALIIATHHYDLLPFIGEGWFTNLTRLIAFIFIIRAIGDFNFFGLFKNKSATKFSQKDSQLFVPLCIYLGLSCFILTLI